MKLLITGGQGFIGSNLVRHMLEKYDYDIINFDILTSVANPETLKDIECDDRYTFIYGDVCKKSDIEEAVNGYDIDCILHLAASSHVDNSIKDASSFIKTNIVGTYNILEVARKYKIKRFYYQGTDEEYGHLGIEDPPFTEITPLNPRNPYSATKASASHLCMSYFYTHKMPIIIGRASNNYGPYQFTEKLLPLAITNLLQGKPIPVYGDGRNIRDWLYVEDTCRAIDLLLHKGKEGEVYNVGGNCERRNIDIVKTLCKLMEVPEGKGIVFIEDRKGHDWRYAINSSKVEKLGWKTEVQIEDKLPDLIKWYKGNEWWWKG